MESPETPLVLLSHAAAFVNRDVENYDDKTSPSSVVITKSQKLKRSSEKVISSSTGQAKIKRSSREPQRSTAVRTNEEVTRSEPVSPHQRDAPPPYTKQLSSSSLYGRSYDPCHCTENSSDKPLDMSKKCGPTQPEQQRPSVITCASTLLRQTHNRRSDLSTTTTNGPSHRREVVSGMCDPVIDEHFRRSLGKDYPEIFSTPASATSVSITVDDHFAKALGETWQRLQEKSTTASSGKDKDSAKLSSPSSLGLVSTL